LEVDLSLFGLVPSDGLDDLLNGPPQSFPLFTHGTTPLGKSGLAWNLTIKSMGCDDLD